MNFKRRTILLGALAVPCLPLLARMPTRATMASTPAQDPVVVRDTTLPESARFAQSSRRASISLMDFRGDVSNLLFERLVPAWRRQSVTAVAGLTDVWAFFCLSRVASDHGLRVIHLDIHRQVAATDWPATVAHTVEGAMFAPTKRQTPSAYELLPRRELAFASWLMVPRSSLLS